MSKCCPTPSSSVPPETNPSAPVPLETNPRRPYSGSTISESKVSMFFVFEQRTASELLTQYLPNKRYPKRTTFILLGLSDFPRVPCPEKLTLGDLKNQEAHIEEISRLLGRIRNLA